MRFSIVAYHLPEPEGTATGRALWAAGTGLLAAGHDVEVWSWSYRPPRGPLPEWCTWRTLPDEPALRTRARALVRPRSDIVRTGWRPPPDAVALADEPVSFPAVAGSSRSVVTLHYLTALDAGALGRRALRDVQSRRAERRVAVEAAAVLAYSPRVANAAARPATWIPLPYDVPGAALPIVEEPVAVLLADWEWPPNVAAAGTLLEVWPSVRGRVPGARLLVAGRHIEHLSIGPTAGVQVVGEVPAALDVLSQAAVVAFPCPDTSGPKVKVLEAIGHGVPVVTTPAGVEGLALRPGSGAFVHGRRAFADGLAAALADPAARAEVARLGREDVALAHAPLPAALARVEACRAALGLEATSS